MTIESLAESFREAKAKAGHLILVGVAFGDVHARQTSPDAFGNRKARGYPLKTYRGACHCEKVVYEATAEIDTVISCNCSICSKKGHLLAFTGSDQFKLLKGQDALTEYFFHKKKIAHLFCKHCGIGTFGRGTGPDGKTMVALNVRCQDTVDIHALTIKPVDGKSF